MPLSIQEKLALMLTLTGTQKDLTTFIGGVTPSQVSKWIKSGLPDVNGNLRFAEPTDPAAIANINAAFDIYKDVARDINKEFGMPFDPALPIVLNRLRLADGTIGDRVIVEKTHFLTDKTRGKIVASLHKTRKFLAISVRSLVNLRIYNKQADSRYESRDHRYRRGRKQYQLRDEFEIREQLGEKNKAINTSLTWLNPRFATDAIIDELDMKLRERHQPAANGKGTKYSTEYLLQIDGSKDELSQFAREQRKIARQQSRNIAEKARRAKAKASGTRKRK